MELDNALAEPSSRPPEELDVMGWNGERGRFVLEETPLPQADIYLLNEMDVGMARTENAHTVRRLAERLGFNYLYAVEFLELTKGEPAERESPGENKLGFHGNAILARYPIHEPRMLRLAGGAQWLDHAQKRLGSRLALVCLIDTKIGPLRVVCTHLESESPPSLRAEQMQQILELLARDENDVPTILGGDWTHGASTSATRRLRSAWRAILRHLLDFCARWHGSHFSPPLRRTAMSTSPPTI